MRRLMTALAALAAIVFVVDGARAQEPDQVESLRKELDKIGKTIQSQRARIVELERQLQTRDREIAELKQKLADAGGKPKPEAPRAPALLGVAHEDPDAETRAKLNLKEGQGAKVTTVHPGSPAEKAGIKEGDVIVSLGGKEIGSAKLGDVVRGHSPGDKLEVVALRGAEKVTSTVELVDREKFLASAASQPAPKPEPPKPAAPPKPDPVVLGVIIEETDAGLTVKSVEAGKTGAAAQLKDEDVIISVNGKAVKKLEDLTEARDKAKVGEELTLEYKRKGEVVKVTVVAAGEKGEPKFVRAERTGAPAAAEAEKKPEAGKGPATLGVVVAEEPEGLKVLELKAGGAAEKAGILKGDVLKEVGGHKLKTTDELKNLLKGRSPGDELKIVLQRGAEAKTLDKVKLGGAGTEVAAAAKPAEEKPAATQPAAKAETPKPTAPQKPRGVLGIVVHERDDLTLEVSSVTAKGAGEKAGLKKDDVILKLNGVEVKGFDALDRVMKNIFAGDVVRLQIKRGEETKEIELQAGGPPEGAADLESRAGASPAAGGGVYVGVAVLEETGAEAAVEPRLTIDEVAAGSPAAHAGLRPGDEILSIGGLPVRSLDDISRAIGKWSVGETVLFRVARAGGTVDAGLTLAEGVSR